MASRFRYGLLPTLLLATILMFASPLLAADCIVVTGVGPSIDKFLGEARAAQAAGTGTMPINDVLFGVTGISAEDQLKLAQRDPVLMTKHDEVGGDYENRGPERITIEGIFAERDTLFRLPKLVLGKYKLSAEGAELVYDPAHPVEVGESVIGIHFFKSVHRTVITPDKLAFIFAGNDGGEPDRCYDVKR